MVSGAARLGFPPMPLGFSAGDGRAEASQDSTERREREGAFRLLQVGGRHSRSPIISRNITGGLVENTSESTCNRSAGGRRHDRKCPTVRKPHSPVRTEGRRSQCAHYHSAGRGRKAWNYRTGQGRWREPHSGIRKPHRTVGTEGRRSQSAALTSENWRVTNEGVKAPSLAGKAPLLGSHVSGFTVPPTHCAPRSPTPLRPQASLPRGPPEA